MRAQQANAKKPAQRVKKGLSDTERAALPAQFKRTQGANLVLAGLTVTVYKRAPLSRVFEGCFEKVMRSRSATGASIRSTIVPPTATASHVGGRDG
jgi:hypothetical protein